jgi:hypothetical protein
LQSEADIRDDNPATIIMAAQRQADGSLVAAAISVGRDGLTPL